jgi:hypothetical protein
VCIVYVGGGEGECIGLKGVNGVNGVNLLDVFYWDGEKSRGNAHTTLLCTPRAVCRGTNTLL